MFTELELLNIQLPRSLNEEFYYFPYKPPVQEKIFFEETDYEDEDGSYSEPEEFEGGLPFMVYG